MFDSYGNLVANISEKTREVRLRWLGHAERKTVQGGCSNDKTKDGNGWTPKDRKAETEME